MRKPVPLSTRSCASGRRSSASSAACSGWNGSRSAQSSSVGQAIRAYASSSSRRARTGRSRAKTAHERARFALPPTSANAWRTRPRAAGFARALSFGPSSGRNTRRAPWLRNRASPGAAAARGAWLGAEQAPGAVAEEPVEPGRGGGARGHPPDGAQRGALGRAVQAVGHEHELAGLQRPGLDRAQEDLGAEVVAADERARPGGVRAERRHHLGEPLQRVRVARAVLGVPVQRQVGEHDAEAVGQVLGDRLPLAVAEERGVQEHEAGARAGLAVGDARAVAVVEEAQLHPVAWPARRPRSRAPSIAGAPAPASTRAALSTRWASSAWMPFVRFAPRRAAPTR